jgi:hypothetical protein
LASLGLGTGEEGSDTSLREKERKPISRALVEDIHIQLPLSTDELSLSPINPTTTL